MTTTRLYNVPTARERGLHGELEKRSTELAGYRKLVNTLVDLADAEGGKNDSKFKGDWREKVITPARALTGRPCLNSDPTKP